MSDGRERLGKVDRSVFDEQIAPRLGADRADVQLGPAHGVDFGVIDAGSATVVAATDPVSVLSDLGLERAGRFAVRFALADVAVSGIEPSHLFASFALPTDFSDEAFGTFWAGVSAVCREQNVAIVGGHTARYPGASLPWIGAATVLGVGTEPVIRPDGARSGDCVIVTRGPGIETAGVFTSLFPEAFDALNADTLAAAQACLDDTGVSRTVRVATEAADGGITAIHDATEGGLQNGLCETAAASNVRFEVERAAVPENSAAIAACDAVGIDPWATTTAGTLVVTARPTAADRVVTALEAAGVSAAVVGEVTTGEGVVIDGDRVQPPPEDESWAAYAALAGRS